MTDNQLENPAQDDVAGKIEVVPFSVGSALRDARVRHGFSVDEISDRIKFAPRQIEALEADDFAHLPETAFVRGFVRSYARLLKLDSEPLLAALPHAPGQFIPLEAVSEVPYPDIYAERRQNIIWLAAALAVAVALALSAWLFGGKPKGQHTPEAMVSAAQNITTETLAPPDILPASAVPDREPVAATAAPAISPGVAMPEVVKPAAVTPEAAKPVAVVPSAAKPGIVTPPAAKPSVAAPVPVAAKPNVVAANVAKPAPVPTGATASGAVKSGFEKSGLEKNSPEKKPAVEVKSAPQVTPFSPVKSTVAPLDSPAAKTKPTDASNPKAAPVSGSIRMTFDVDSWVEIKDKDGKRLLSQINHAGNELHIGGSAPFTLVIGSASGVHLYYKGKAVDLEPYTEVSVAHLTLE